jgi:hypothetical protein
MVDLAEGFQLFALLTIIKVVILGGKINPAHCWTRTIGRREYRTSFHTTTELVLEITALE